MVNSKWTLNNQQLGNSLDIGKYQLPTHIRCRDTWYKVPEKYMRHILHLVDVDDMLVVFGSVFRPRPMEIRSLTELLSFLSRKEVSPELIALTFGEDTVKRMKGRVLKRLVS